ncbi:hypothetical protein BDZ91DRAFT_763282 [Kalaharituber pfeilii]|nr:hypothetical protein BDZ91DRAFT_763282 [Kalaharituber pfeilii]
MFFPFAIYYSFRSGYTYSNLSINFNLYTKPPPTSDPIPGPSIWVPSGGSTGGGNTDGSVAKWGQCGGLNYSGPTTCAEGTCVKVNDYYNRRFCVLDLLRLCFKFVRLLTQHTT